MSRCGGGVYSIEITLIFLGYFGCKLMDNSFLPYYLITSALLFSIGLAVVLTKRNVIVVLMGIELMLNAVNLNLIAFSKNDPNLQGQMFALFVIVVAVCESVIALAIILKAFEHFKTVNLDEISELKG